MDEGLRAAQPGARADHGREDGVSDEGMTCLFCGRGGVRVMVIDEVTDPGCDIANVPIYATSCPYCGARGPMALSEGEAVAAWNRRAGTTCEQRRTRRTCHVESSHEEEGDGCYWYFKYELSCGHDIAWGDQLPPSYCPECGRRVQYDSNDYI